MILGIDPTLDVGAFIAAFFTALAVATGVAQYLKAERWKRAEFAVSQLRLLTSDQTLAFCCRALDWAVGPLMIPEKYLSLFPTGTVQVTHNVGLLEKALRPDLHCTWDSPSTKAQFLLYRYAFDDFFSYLDSLALYRDLRVIRGKDLSALDYYMSRIKMPPYSISQLDGRDPLKVFGEFVERFYPKRVWPWVKNSETLTYQHGTTICASSQTC